MGEPPWKARAREAREAGARFDGEHPPVRCVRPISCSFDHWLFWWTYNREDQLDVRTRLEAAGGRRVETRAGSEVGRCLLETIRNREMNDDIRGAALVALARCRLGDVRALDPAMAALAAPGRYLARGASIAPGQIAERAPEQTRREASRALVRSPQSPGDPQAREFARIALGRIASAPDSSDELRRFVADALEADTSSGKGPVESSLTALALGMTASVDSASAGLRHRIADGLRGVLAEGRRSDGNAGGYAVALGLLGDGRSGTIDLLTDLATDRGVEKKLRGAALLALGRIGDERAVPDLLRILEPEKASGAFPDPTRALATVALGQIVDDRPITVLFCLTKDVNDRASVPALDELLTIL